MSTHIRSFDPAPHSSAARASATRSGVSRITATLAAAGLATGITITGAATANAGAHQGAEPCSALQPGTTEMVGGDVFVLPAETPGGATFAFRFGPTQGPAVVNYSVDWQNHTTGESGSFIGSTLPQGDVSQINQTHPTGDGHVTWQVTELEIASVDRPDLGAFTGVGCEGEKHLPV